MDHKGQPLLFCGSSHLTLGKEISRLSNIPLGKLSLGQFPDGEISVEILEEVRGRDLFVLQSTAPNPNFHLLELLIIIDALKRASAKTITTIIPYFGYCRQDRKDKPGEPITAKLIANMLSVAGMTHLLTIDLHAGQLEGFFEQPVTHLHSQKLLIQAAQNTLEKPCTILAPDIGSIKIAKKAAQLLNAELAIIEKQRLSESELHMTLIGQVKGKNILIVDDLCSTGTTLLTAAELCKKQGAKNIIAAVTHGILSGDAISKIEDSVLLSLITTNTVPEGSRFIHAKKVTTVSVAGLIADQIKL